MEQTLMVFIAIVALAGIVSIELALQRRSRTTLQQALRAQTIPQVLIVLVVIGAVAFLGYGSVQFYKQWSARTTCTGNLKTIAEAVEGYDTVQGNYPASISAVTIASLEPTGATQSSLGSLPQDPAAPNGSYSYTYTAGSGGTPPTYIIVCPGGHNGVGVLFLSGTDTNGQITLNNSGSYGIQ